MPTAQEKITLKHVPFVARVGGGSKWKTVASAALVGAAPMVALFGIAFGLEILFDIQLAYGAAIGLALVVAANICLVIHRRRWRRLARRHDFLLCLECGHPVPVRKPTGQCPECGVLYSHACCQWGWRKYDGLVRVASEPPPLPARPIVDPLTEA